MRNTQGQFVRGTHWRKPKPFWEREWLEAEYVTKGRSAREIGEAEGCTENNILHWLHKLGIPRRTISEARKVKYWGLCRTQNGMAGRTGDTNPNWRGGISPERQRLYSSWEWADVVRFVWERDRAHCTECGKHETRRRRMYVHHEKDFDNHPRLRCDATNLRLVCSTCHGRIHAERRREARDSAEGCGADR